MTDLELEIKLDQFKPREYQLPVCDAFLNKGCKKLMIIWPRRCLPGETFIPLWDPLVFPHFGGKLLKDIKVGDQVVSWSGYLEKGVHTSIFEADTVVNVWRTEDKKATIKIVCEDGTHIVTSYDHLFAVETPNGNIGWLKAGDLSFNHTLLLMKGTRLDNRVKKCRIKSILSREPQYCYDIETEKNHNFIAQGFIVHNSGKDLVCFNLLLRAALQKVGIYYAIYPTYSQAKKILFDGMTNSGFKFLSFIPKELIASINASEMKIVLRNNSLIQLVGSTDYDKLMGTNVCGCMISEYGLTDGQAYGYIRPMLNANDGFCMILSTPRGHNCLWELYSVAINSPDWFVSKLTLDETKHIDPMLIEHEIASGETSRDLALQEYWTSFSCGQAGSFYGSIIDRMRLNGQIASVPYESHLVTSTSWDIGLDSTVIIWFQVTATGLIRIIDFYENQNLSLDHYIGVLKSKHYLYNKHVAPHDMANREFSTGVSRLELAKRLDVKFTLAPNISIQDGIEATRAMLSKTYIDDVKCKDLVKHLENYRQEYDEKRKTYTGKPLHDIHSHASDALRMLAVALPKVCIGTTADDLDRRYREAMYGTQNQLPKFFRD